MDYNKLSTDELEKNFNPRESVENFNHYLEDSLLKSKYVKKEAHIYENIESLQDLYREVPGSEIIH